MPHPMCYTILIYFDLLRSAAWIIEAEHFYKSPVPFTSLLSYYYAIERVFLSSHSGKSNG